MALVLRNHSAMFVSATFAQVHPGAGMNCCFRSTSLQPQQSTMSLFWFFIHSIWLHGSTGLSKLAVLDIGNNAFTGMLSEYALQNMTSLSVCKFSENKISGSLPEEGVMGLASLTSFVIHTNEMMGRLPDGLKGMTFLAILDLGRN
eukprot:1686479-Amphidinium_carterae.1